MNIVITVIAGVISLVNVFFFNDQDIKSKIKNNPTIKTIINKNQEVSLLVSTVGDCTIGSDPKYGSNGSFHTIWEQNLGDYGYFFRGVSSVLATDDLTIANLETTFTEATNGPTKNFHFKGPSHYAKILTFGSIEAVNIANNHINDYYQQGYNDTVDTLNEHEIPFFGEKLSYIYEVKGIKIGLLGYSAFLYDVIYEDVKRGIEYLQSMDVDLIFVSFHWGVEKNYHHIKKQTDLAHFTIDNGADLIIGHHPHVIQGIEKYKDKYIIYSLANFVFGGNRNPADKDSFIFQIEYMMKNKEIKQTNINIVPVSVSSKSNYNDFQPQILSGEDEKRIKDKILSDSVNFTY